MGWEEGDLSLRVRYSYCKQRGNRELLRYLFAGEEKREKKATVDGRIHPKKKTLRLAYGNEKGKNLDPFSMPAKKGGGEPVPIDFPEKGKERFALCYQGCGQALLSRPVG